MFILYDVTDKLNNLKKIQNGEKHNGEITKRRTYKTAKTKRRLLQNGEYTKRRLLQNGDYYKTATTTKRRLYKMTTATKRRLLQNGDSFKQKRRILQNRKNGEYQDGVNTKRRKT